MIAVTPGWGPRARRTLLLSLLGAVLASPAAAQAQSADGPRNVSVDPIRCWWRSTSAAVRTGEAFNVILTCAVLDNEAVQVVPDETRLAPTTISLVPFEVVGGAHPADLRRAGRRFFQYHYTLRIISRDAIGMDVSLPPVDIHYRINSRIGENAALEGRDHNYLLPPHPVHVVSMVPQEAADIRDASTQDFAAVEALLFRASVFEILAVTLLVLGAIAVIVSAVRALVHLRRDRPAAEQRLSDGAVLGVASRELARVQREAAEQGWSEALAGRALAAARVSAALALDRTASQRPQSAADTAEGRLLVPRRRRRALSVSSSTTPEDAARALVRLPLDASPARRETLEEAHAILAAFGSSQYGRPTGSADRQRLDDALARALALTRRLQADRRWSLDLIRRRFSRQAELESQA